LESATNKVLPATATPLALPIVVLLEFVSWLVKPFGWPTSSRAAWPVTKVEGWPKTAAAQKRRTGMHFMRYVYGSSDAKLNHKYTKG
jgi:hypothetical protein